MHGNFFSGKHCRSLALLWFLSFTGGLLISDLLSFEHFPFWLLFFGFGLEANYQKICLPQPALPVTICQLIPSPGAGTGRGQAKDLDLLLCVLLKASWFCFKIYVCLCACACLSVRSSVCCMNVGAQKSQKTVSDLLEVELQEFLSTQHRCSGRDQVL